MVCLIASFVCAPQSRFVCLFGLFVCLFVCRSRLRFGKADVRFRFSGLNIDPSSTGSKKEITTLVLEPGPSQALSQLVLCGAKMGLPWAKASLAGPDGGHQQGSQVHPSRDVGCLGALHVTASSCCSTTQHWQLARPIKWAHSSDHSWGL